jgi:hypothetical protein
LGYRSATPLNTALTLANALNAVRGRSGALTIKVDRTLSAPEIYFEEKFLGYLNTFDALANDQLSTWDISGGNIGFYSDNSVGQACNVYGFAYWNMALPYSEIRANSMRGFPSLSSSRRLPQTFTAATTDIITAANHGLISGSRVRFSSSGTLPAGLTAGTDYYLRDVTADTFKVSTTVGGAAVDITDTGSGTHTLTPAGLQNYYRLIEGEGWKFYDSSGYGRTLARVQGTPNFVNPKVVGATYATTGTTGNASANTVLGSHNIAVGQQTITITNPLVSANSIIEAWLGTIDTTATRVVAVAGAGSFNLTLNANATAEVRVHWKIHPYFT